jgi:hypothetical protein
MRAGGVLLALLGIVPLANLVTAGREVPWWRGAWLIWLAYGGLLLAVLWVVSDRWGAPLDRLSSRLARALERVPSSWFVLAASAWTTIAAIGVALYCYAGRGSTSDEMAMAWHARMLLAGHLAIPAPAHPEFFDIAATIARGPRWYSQYPIGGPVLLAVGLALHAIWLVNPLLLGVACWQLHRFTRRAFGESTARAATLLFGLTPFILVLGATQMSHAASLVLTLLALAELASWDDDATSRRALHAVALGLSIGAIALVRPLDAVLVALPIGVFQLVRVRQAPARLGSLLLQAAAGALPIALLLWANARTTGGPLLFAYDVANGPAHRLGFHLDPNGELHTPLRGLVYASGYLMRFDRFLFEWPLPGLLVVCAVLLMLRRASRWDSLLLALVGAFLVGYAAYWFPGFFDGPRFLFPVAPVLVLYAARAPEAFARVANPIRRRWGRAIVPACVLCAWLIPLTFSSVPGRLAGLHAQRTKLKTDVAAQARAAGLSNAVVLVPESWRGRLLAQLRARGLGQFESERVVNTVDACALQLALDDSSLAATASRDSDALRSGVVARAAAAGRATLVPDRAADERIALSPTGPRDPRCGDELARDTVGTMPYAMFLREQTVLRDGRLGGPVIYARSLGPRDSLLRAEYGGRRWYLYRPGRSLDEAGTFRVVREP